MPQGRHYDDQPEQRRDRAEHQQTGDDQPPHRHWAGVGDDRAQRGHDRRRDPDLAVDQERERHDADREGQEGEQKADANADHDHRPAACRRQHVTGKSGDRGRRLGPQGHVVDRHRGAEPQQKQRQQYDAQPHDRAE